MADYDYDAVVNEVSGLTARVMNGEITPEQAMDIFNLNHNFPQNNYGKDVCITGPRMDYMPPSSNRESSFNDFLETMNALSTVGDISEFVQMALGTAPNLAILNELAGTIGVIFTIGHAVNLSINQKYDELWDFSVGNLMKFGGAQIGVKVGGKAVVSKVILGRTLTLGMGGVAGLGLYLAMWGLHTSYKWATELGTPYATSVGGISFFMPNEIYKEHFPTCLDKESEDARDVERRISPIILDLDGDGVETMGVSDANVMFDFDGDGIKNKTGWAGSDDGFLVFDRNGDGNINGGGEMFGEHTLKYDGTGYAKDGFEALAQEDSNGDDIINASDANWHNLKVWRDLNQNGITDAGELFSLDELGIESLNLNYTNTNQTLDNGNYVYASAQYTTMDGQTRDMVDIFLAQKHLLQRIC